MTKTKIYIRGKDNTTLVRVDINPDLIGAYSPQRRVELPPELWGEIVKAAKKGSSIESNSYSFVISNNDTTDFGVSAEYRLEPGDKKLLSQEMIDILELETMFNYEHTHSVNKRKVFEALPVYIERKLTREEKNYSVNKTITKDVFVKKLFTPNPLGLFKERIKREVHDRTIYHFKAYATNPIPVLKWYNVYVQYSKEEKTITKSKIEPSLLKLLFTFIRKK